MNDSVYDIGEETLMTKDEVFVRKTLRSRKMVCEAIMASLVHHQYKLPLVDLIEKTVHEFVSFVYTRDGNPFSVEVPATWFQHFKRDRFPKWLLKRFPVRYTKAFVPVEEVLVRYATPDYPERVIVRKIESGPIDLK